MKKNLSILLVDDEEEFVVTLAERLEIRGFSPTIAEDGETALSIFTPDTFDLVLLDLMMPGIGGLEVLAKLKEIQPTVPVILLTGHGSTREGMEGMRLGAFDYLMKPLNIEELIRKIQEAVPDTVQP
ncbi:response regulator receiver domain-containing protein [Desulfobotulus alkaliphilus]|uniref:Response regulator receiver domain-containing protein n=1 Tax=Desulfobotulus alkaliphilus TaxID=622671 RepID=A0A562RYH3_9BACT|nr:response regulator [Desulfobotulus alkaliphilus]TWI74139.1 response regulator receiver domain-containing protein [Desulfobotulus alkaliphilus]